MFRRRAADRPAAPRLADVTARWPVRIRTDNPFKFHGPGLDSGWLSLRGDFIEITQGPVARRLNGREFNFPVREAWLRVEPGDFNFGRQWLTITGTCDGRPAFVSVSAGGRGAVEELWHALVAAGARREQDLSRITASVLARPYPQPAGDPARRGGSAYSRSTRAARSVRTLRWLR